MYQDALDATFKATMEKHAAELEKKAFLPALAGIGRGLMAGARFGGGAVRGAVNAGTGVAGKAGGLFGQTGAGFKGMASGMGTMMRGNMAGGASQLAAGAVRAAPAMAVGGAALYGANRMGHASGAQQEQNKPMYQRVLGQ